MNGRTLWRLVPAVLLAAGFGTAVLARTGYLPRSAVVVAAGVGGVLWGLHMLATPAVHSLVLSGSLPNASEGARERAPRWTRAKGVLALVFGLAMLGLAVAN